MEIVAGLMPTAICRACCTRRVGRTGVNTLLSQEETYAEIAPVRLDRNGVSGFIAIMRGCSNFTAPTAWCRPIRAASSGAATPRDDSGRGPASCLWRRLHHGEVTLLGQERQLLPFRRGRLSPRADAPRGRHLAPASGAVRHLAPERISATGCWR